VRSACTPYFWAIRAGDPETGVTLHRLEPEYDTGAIIAQRKLAIRPDENAWQLARRLDRPSLALLVDCARWLADGERLEGNVQDDGAATAAPKPSEDDLTVDWHLPATELARLVRAAAPAPGASALFEDSLVTLEGARVSSAKPPGGLEIGEAWCDGDAVHVRCGERALEILAVRVEDGTDVTSGTLLRGPDIAELL
jgi:methionyl-tRNA formyltransferase